MIRVDATPHSVVVVCTLCPPYRVLRGTRDAALTAAADHAQLVHGDERGANTLRDRARRVETRRAK